MGYWKSTVVPKFKKLFEKNSLKKAGAAEACKSFDDAKVYLQPYLIFIEIIYGYTYVGRGKP